MRTTLTLTEDVYRAAKSLAAAKKISLGAAVSELARRGLLQGRDVTGESFPTFAVGKDDPPVTPEQVRDAMEEW